jgi:hypothetical protein
MHDAATMLPAPGQHMRALQRANAVRVARAELKRDVERGAVSVAEVILNAPWEAASMTIAELLTSQRQWGTIRSRKFLTGIGIAETKTIASLTERQRSLLATMI